MRRKPGTLLPLEVSVLAVAVEAQRTGEKEFHGFAIAKAVQEHEAARRLTAHGTLYKALGRMERAGLLESRWEDAEVAATEQRPRRRLYRVTGAGARALATSLAEQPGARYDFRPGLAGS
ncbi:MAG: PadR family transcriptional regulator [Acidimicrobiales bacterium]